MKVKLAELELPQVTQVVIFDSRALAEHKPPGAAGSFLQDLGRHPSAITVFGVATGPSPKDFVEKLERHFRDAKPVIFMSNVSAAASIRLAVITDVVLAQTAGSTRYLYQVELCEFLKPSSSSAAAGVDSAVRSEAHQAVTNMAKTLTNRN